MDVVKEPVVVEESSKEPIKEAANQGLKVKLPLKRIMEDAKKEKEKELEKEKEKKKKEKKQEIVNMDVVKEPPPLEESSKEPIKEATNQG